MKIYTKTGDRGQTGLIGGQRVSKASARIEAYGTVDELNAALGVAASQPDAQAIVERLWRLQSDLHLVCADLAAPAQAAQTPRVMPSHVAYLEELCDDLEAQLPPLQQFILPGGTAAGAHLHLARTVARRAERRVIELAQAEPFNSEVIRYLNRLSDLLFLMARQINQQQNVPEHHPDYR